MRILVKGFLKNFYPKVLVTYATGRRPDMDAEGTGPGMFYAWWIAQRLQDYGVDCLSGLCVGGGPPTRVEGGARRRMHSGIAPVCRCGSAGMRCSLLYNTCSTDVVRGT